MSDFSAQLNLRPQEQRLVVVIALVLFVVLNLWFVWPHFDDWSRINASLAKAHVTLADYRKEVAQAPEYQLQLKRLENQGSAVLPAEQARELQRTILTEARQNGFVPDQTTPLQAPRSAATNQFFEEQAVRITVRTGEKELVNFLYALGSGNSMIRVRDMDLLPDPGSGHTLLMGHLTLVASYQKQAGANLDAKPKLAPPRRSALRPELRKAPPQIKARKTNPARRMPPRESPPRSFRRQRPVHQPPATSNRM